jgi:thioredoxin-like negative regulator of GroEL
MRCPKCGFDQSEAESCGRCGIIVARYTAARSAPSLSASTGARPTLSSRTAAPATREASSSLSRTFLWLTAVVILAVAAARWTLQRPAPQPAQSVPPALTQSATTPAPPQESDIPAEPLPSFTAQPIQSTVPELPPVTSTCPISNAPAPSDARQVTSYWHTGASGFEDAVRRRVNQTAPMVVYVFTDWCGYCRRFDQDLLSSSEVESFLRQHAFRVRLNPEDGPAERALAHQLGARDYPTFLIYAGGSARGESFSVFGGSAELLSPQELIEGIRARTTQAARRLVSEGSNRRRAGDVAGALERLDRAVEVAPELEDAYAERALARAEAGRTDDALRDLAAVAALRPRAIEPYQQATEALTKVRRLDEVVACWTAWLGQDAHSGIAFEGRARAHQARGDMARARADAEQACKYGAANACSLVASR